MSYNPNEVIADGPITAPRWAHHVLKALIAIAIYAGLREGLHWKPAFAMIVASPAFIVVVTVKEWVAPSDPLEHTYSLWLRACDFLTDFSCTSPAIALWLLALHRWEWALGVFWVALGIYLVCRKNARP